MQEHIKTSKGAKIYGIRLLICVAQADGYMDETEKEWIYYQVGKDVYSVRERQVFHDDMENPKDWQKFAEEICPLLTWKEKLIFIRKIFKLASLDKQIKIEEKNIIYQISYVLQVEEEKIKEIENWVMDGINWVAKWNQILSRNRND